ncbi:MAG: aspartate-semialdehyde dehydrogenase [Anaerolineae bacterium]|jgi:aspartate-semialdehyde dehydrogenase|nr:aspartate-semialdehyde dehydrogenase [Anaerolineae bacterium]
MAEDHRIPVGVLGATGAVGQRFAQLLADHPWFEITALAASERSAGHRYGDICQWVIPGDPPTTVRDLIVRPLTPDLPAKIVFSAVPSDVAREIEPQFAQASYLVCSNASAFRNGDDIPLLIPELNADHHTMIARQREQRGWPGLIVTSPNCTITGVAMALKPLDDAFGVRQVFMTSMQAISGAGYPGVSAMDITDNVIPYIAGEEEKFQQELAKLLGHVSGGVLTPAGLTLSAHANRVPVLDGHTVSLSVGFERHPTPEEALEVLRAYRPPEVCAGLVSSPATLIRVRTETDRPQPRRDRDATGGMAVSIGRVRPCPILDLRMTTVVHNTLRGAASGAILNAELLVAAGYAEA